MVENLYCNMVPFLSKFYFTEIGSPVNSSMTSSISLLWFLGKIFSFYCKAERIIARNLSGNWILTRLIRSKNLEVNTKTGSFPRPGGTSKQTAYWFFFLVNCQFCGFQRRHCDKWFHSVQANSWESVEVLHLIEEKWNRLIIMWHMLPAFPTWRSGQKSPRREEIVEIRKLQMPFLVKYDFII